jgi:L-seryl-tRNA(Ser) seleniumtransferase
LRRNPIFRALRLDKLIYHALETTMRLLVLGRWEEIPALKMIAESADRIRERAERFVASLPALDAEVVPGVSVIGGGTTPERPISTWLVAVKHRDVVALEAGLRAGDPAIIARIEDDRLLIDLRTVFPEEEPEVISALQARS